MTRAGKPRMLRRALPLWLTLMLMLSLHSITALAQDDDIVLSEGFEGQIPDLHTYQATYAADTTRAHSGAISLHVTPEGRGGAYFRLDGLIDPEQDYEFSVWAYAETDGAIELYISASDGERRHTKASVAGGRAGEWVKLTGGVRAEEWRDSDSSVMLAMVTRGQAWFDDVEIVAADIADPPMDVYPEVEALLRAQADTRARSITPGGLLTLSATDAACAADLARPEVTLPESLEVDVPADGLLTFAIDVPEPMYVTGSVILEPDSDLRPGLRAYILSDTALIAAPMIVAPAWGPVPVREATPEIEGGPLPGAVPLTEWLLTAGRHYITVAGPHFRPAGQFQQLRLSGVARPVEEPLYTFALLSDTHVSTGRGPWMNVIMRGPSGEALPGECERLRAEGVDFAIIAGDMTNSGVRGDFEILANALAATELPIYGCVGNHDAYHSSSRPEMLELVPGLFPGGDFNYTFERGPLRFIVLDASYWRNREGEINDFYESDSYVGIGLQEGQVEWLRETLEADTLTPTIVIWHYGFYDRLGESSCGHLMRPSTCVNSAEVCDLLEETPSVVATLCGHSHWNQANVLDGITHIQNPGFAEWPNAFRVFRVYEDRMEWEVRQVSNRGFVREAFIVEKAQSWQISTGPDDLAGAISLER